MQEKLKTVLKAWISYILSTTFFRSVLKTYWILIKYYSIWNSLNWVCPILWPPPAKSWLTGKDPNAGRDWGQEEKGTTEDEMVGWHHRLDDMSLSELREFITGEWTGRPGELRFMGLQRVRQRLSDWTELTESCSIIITMYWWRKQVTY